jgi:hypothetical protein
MSKDGRASIHAPQEGLNSFFYREVFEILLTGQISLLPNRIFALSAVGFPAPVK